MSITGKLAGKVALVMGGTTGIGLASAQDVAAQGAAVYISGRRQTELDAAVAAKAVTFLASDDSTPVNGIELFVDGGIAQI